MTLYLNQIRACMNSRHNQTRFFLATANRYTLQPYPCIDSCILCAYYVHILMQVITDNALTAGLLCTHTRQRPDISALFRKHTDVYKLYSVQSIKETTTSLDSAIKGFERALVLMQISALPNGVQTLLTNSNGLCSFGERESGMSLQRGRSRQRRRDLETLMSSYQLATYICESIPVDELLMKSTAVLLNRVVTEQKDKGMKYSSKRMKTSVEQLN